ncbi:MAG: carbamoyltransferase HypF [Chitinophagaceae bacterium]|nr:carbamoyltransferase HypF [Chitinophagaceae bacterium]
MEQTFHILIQGIVQGVGFRPMLYHYAMQNEMKGNICNSSDGLHFYFNATTEKATTVLEFILSNRPPLATITNATLTNIADEKFNSLKIVTSNTNSVNSNSVLLTPDYAVCHECINDVNDKKNRRYRYPFTTCAICGPRFSIINELPYERHHTTMQPYTMCKNCEAEYNDVHNRRFYAQTISCNECGIQMQLFNANNEIEANGNEDVLLAINKALQSGKTIAIKGIGGFLLICDATNQQAIKSLRQRKHRPAKPFAIMCKNTTQANEFAFLSAPEIENLNSVVAPIVLAKAKQSDLALQHISPNLNTIGIMLAYTPLFQIILEDFGKPIVATSANLSGSPIVFTNEQALQSLNAFADYIVINDRDILLPQDDSVMRFSPKYQQKIIIRRSRGLAPNYFSKSNFNEDVLSTGAMLKSSFAFTANNNVYISQFLGNTESYDAQQMYQHSLQHLLQVTDTKPTKTIADMHPQFFSHQLAKEWDSNAQEIQHHEAHLMAVLAENNLLNHNNVLGVIWDGIGWGDNHTILGGEFYTYNAGTISDHFYFDFFNYTLADKMATEPRIAALAICANIDEAKVILQEKFTTTEWQYFNNVLKQPQKLQCSSVGRLFDAVGSLLGLIDIQSYEGQTAMLLEQLAQTYFDKNGYDFPTSYFKNKAISSFISTQELILGIVQDVLNKEEISFIAAKFHYSLIDLVKEIAEENNSTSIACSGGVFQNAVLVDLMIHYLGKNYSVYFHQQLSPNDENISFGQLIHQQQQIKINHHKKEKIICV